ncbi:MAG: UvrD-helicase domain-containing protein [Mailhella sp.]|nr:UvrD-helicase domain-containing protein [Mailhella sp.]
MTDKPASADPRIIKIDASAGTGKTYQLTKRFIDLMLSQNGHPASFDEILAITFTNAAAGEMQDRVLSGLKEIALSMKEGSDAAHCAVCGSLLQPEGNGGTGSPKPTVCSKCKSKAEENLNNIFRRYSALNIRTIDSLLDRIVRVSVLDLRLPPDYEIRFDEDSVLEELLSKACLAALRSGDQCATVAAEAARLIGLLPAEHLRTAAKSLLGILSFDSAGAFTADMKLFLVNAETKAADAEKHLRSAFGQTVPLTALLKEIAGCQNMLDGEKADDPSCEEELIPGRVQILSRACDALLSLFTEYADQGQISVLAGLRDRLETSAVLRRAYSAYLDGQEATAGFINGTGFKKLLFSMCRYLICLLNEEIPMGSEPAASPFSRVCKKLTPPEELEAIRAEVDEKRIRNCAELRDLCSALQDLCKRERLPLKKHFSDALCKIMEGGSSSSAYLAKGEFKECLNGGAASTAEAESLYAEIKVLYRESTDTTASALIRTGIRNYRLLEAASVLCDALLQTEKTEGIVLGSRLPMLAEQPLSPANGASDTLIRMSNKLEHILIDEFQDTSRAQWGALNPLGENVVSDGGSVFFVGDIKQSIYGWRGGDSKLFSEAPLSLAKGEQDKIRTTVLKKNRRSAENVIEWNNLAFGQLNPPDTAKNTSLLKRFLPDSLPDGLGKEEIEKALRDASALLGDNYATAAQNMHKQSKGFVIALSLPAKGNRDNLYDAAVLSVLPLLVRKLAALDGGPVNWANTGILTRTNDECSQVSAVLRKCGIPVVTEGSLLLADHPLIRECVSLLRFIDDPRNDRALWHILTGRLLHSDAISSQIGVVPSKADLHALALRPKGCTLQDALRASEKLSPLWERFLKPFAESMDYRTAYDTMSEMLGAWGAEQSFPDQAVFLRRFLEVMHLAEESGASSPASFLRWWEGSSGSERAPIPPDKGGVQVMTIHKSKGLQFRNVIAPFHDMKIEPDDKITIRSISIGGRSAAVAVPCKKELGIEFVTQTLQQGIERVNALYVAWTRAEERLVILTPSDIPPSKNGMLTSFGRFERFVHDLLEKVKNAPDKTNKIDIPVKIHMQKGQEARLDCILMGEDKPPLDENALQNDLQFVYDRLVSAQEEAEADGRKKSAVILNAAYETARMLDERHCTAKKNGAKAQMNESGSAEAAPHGEDIPPCIPGAKLRRLPALKTFRTGIRGTGQELSSTERGTLVHKTLEYLTGGERALDSAFDQALADLALPSIPESDRDSVLRSLRWFIDLPWARTALRTGMREHSVAAPPDGQGEAGHRERGLAEGDSAAIFRIDLLVPVSLGTGQETRDGWCVVDYKTGYEGTVPDKDNLDQISNYIRIVSEATGKPAAGALAYLDRRRVCLVPPAGTETCPSILVKYGSAEALIAEVFE